MDTDTNKATATTANDKQLRHVCSECGQYVSTGELVDGGHEGGFCEDHPKATVETIAVSEESLVAEDAATEQRERNS